MIRNILLDNREKINKNFIQYIELKYYLNYLFNKGLLNEEQVKKVKAHISKLYIGKSK